MTCRDFYAASPATICTIIYRHYVYFYGRQLDASLNISWSFSNDSWPIRRDGLALKLIISERELTYSLHTGTRYRRLLHSTMKFIRHQLKFLPKRRWRWYRRKQQRIRYLEEAACVWHARYAAKPPTLIAHSITARAKAFITMTKLLMVKLHHGLGAIWGCDTLSLLYVCFPLAIWERWWLGFLSFAPGRASPPIGRLFSRAYLTLRAAIFDTRGRRLSRAREI